MAGGGGGGADKISGGPPDNIKILSFSVVVRRN